MTIIGIPNLENIADKEIHLKLRRQNIVWWKKTPNAFVYHLTHDVGKQLPCKEDMYQSEHTTGSIEKAIAELKSPCLRCFQGWVSQ